MVSLFNLQYAPQPQAKPYLDRVLTKSDDDFEISIAVLTPADCLQVFGVPLANRGVQAVWVRVANRSQIPTRLLLTRIASDYFTAREAAGICHFSLFKRLFAFGFFIWWFLWILVLALPFKIVAVNRANRRMNECFQALGFPLKNILPGTVAEGMVFTPHDYGAKVVTIGLLASQAVREYSFTVDMPERSLDYQKAARAIPEPPTPTECDLETLRTKLQAMPAATTNARGHRHGDPVNLVVVGSFNDLIGVFAPRWDQTEVITLQSCWRTVKAFLLGSDYRYSPVSALYLFERPQDFALQRVRDSINERLHLRLWNTAYTHNGQTVWIGQVSRDIGVRFTTQTWNLTTHRIDPNTDEARDYVLEDLFEAQRIFAGGYLDGVDACTPESPRHNLTGDPYYTDGQRAVIIVSESRTMPKILTWS